MSPRTIALTATRRGIKVESPGSRCISVCSSPISFQPNGTVRFSVSCTFLRPVFFIQNVLNTIPLAELSMVDRVNRVLMSRFCCALLIAGSKNSSKHQPMLSMSRFSFAAMLRLSGNGVDFWAYWCATKC